MLAVHTLWCWRVLRWLEQVCDAKSAALNKCGGAVEAENVGLWSRDPGGV